MNISEICDVKQLLVYCLENFRNIPTAKQPRIGALVSLGFCNIIYSSLNSTQQDAVAEVMLYWSGKSAPRYEELREYFFNAITTDMEREGSGANESRNRLVWCAFNKDTPFDEIFCEFVVQLGVDLEIPVPQMANVLSDVVFEPEAGNRSSAVN